MRIISKWKDYYDTALAYGVDNSILYARTKYEHTISDNIYRASDITGLPEKFQGLESIITKFKKLTCHVNRYAFTRANANPKLTVVPVLIGFCGTFTLAYDVTFTRSNYEHQYYYKLEDVIKVITDEVGDSIWTNHRNYYGLFDLNPTDLKRSFEEVESFNKLNKKDDLFIDTKSPIFMITRNKESGIVIELNPQLSKFNFAKVVDPYSAFNRISQYLSGAIGNTEIDNFKMTDNEKRDSHGFNKYSFRKDKK